MTWLKFLPPLLILLLGVFKDHVKVRQSFIIIIMIFLFLISCWVVIVDNNRSIESSNKMALLQSTNDSLIFLSNQQKTLIDSLIQISSRIESKAIPEPKIAFKITKENEPIDSAFISEISLNIETQKIITNLYIQIRAHSLLNIMALKDNRIGGEMVGARVQTKDTVGTVRLSNPTGKWTIVLASREKLDLNLERDLKIEWEIK